MGEAKRRRDRQSQPLEYQDILTDELRTARNAGDPIEFLARMRALSAANKRGERPIAPVACNGCSQCCYSKSVAFDPSLERAADLAHLDTVATDKPGEVRLRKRDDGACVHLGAGGCSVYEHRPHPCRLYDCRIFALVAMVDAFDGGRQSPVWIFDPHNRRGQILREGFRFMGMTYAGQKTASGVGFTAEETLRYAMQHIDQWCEAMGTLANLSPDQLTEALGFDPRAVSEDQMKQAMKALTTGLRTV